MSKTTQDYDLSLSYAYHYDELPSLHRDLVSIGSPPFFAPNYEVSQRYHREHTIGSDFETLLGKAGVRGEFAYTWGDRFVSDSPERTDGTVKKDAFVGIVGGDYTFKNRVYVNVQYYMQYIPDHEAGMTSRRYEDSLIYKVSRKFIHDTLLLEATGRLYLYNLDRYWELKCEYALTDALTMAVGYDNFFGPPDTTFGQYNKNDQFFVKAKYSF